MQILVKTKTSVLFAAWSFWNLKPEFFVEWKAPLQVLDLVVRKFRLALVLRFQFRCVQANVRALVKSLNETVLAWPNIF